MLVSGGYAAEVFASGTQLLKALAESHGVPPDVVLIDASLEEDSLETLRQVKARTKDLPVMIISAFASVRSAVSFLKQGACDYLVKPILNEELMQLLSYWIDRRRLVAENRSLRAEVQRRFDPNQVVFRSDGFSKVLSLMVMSCVADHGALPFWLRGVNNKENPFCEASQLFSNRFRLIFLRLDTPSGIGTCVPRWFHQPTNISVRPAIPACTAYCPRTTQSCESKAFVGMLRIV